MSNTDQDDDIQKSIEAILCSGEWLSVAQVVDRLGLGVAHTKDDMISHGEVRQIMFRLERQGRVSRNASVGLVRFRWSNPGDPGTDPLIRIRDRQGSAASDVWTTPEEIQQKASGDWERSLRRIVRLVDLEVEFQGGSRRSPEMARQVLQRIIGRLDRKLDRDRVEQILVALRSGWEGR
jgi:hypothetical protein